MDCIETVTKSILYVHNNTDPKNQWDRAVRGLASMNKREIAQTWVSLADNASEGRDPCSVIIKHSKLKRLFKMALAEARPQGVDSEFDTSAFQKIDECLKHSIDLCTHFQKSWDELQSVRHAFMEYMAPIQRSGGQSVAASEISSEPSEHPPSARNAIHQDTGGSQQIAALANALQLQQADTTAIRQTLTTLQTSVADLRLNQPAAAVDIALLRQVADAMPVVREDVRGLTDQMEDLRARHQLLTTQQRALEAETKHATDTALAAEGKAEALGNLYPSLRSDIDAAAASAHEANEKVAEVDGRVDIMGPLLADLRTYTERTDSIARDALLKAGSLDAAVAGLEMSKVDKTEFEETLQRLQPQTLTPSQVAERERQLEKIRKENENLAMMAAGVSARPSKPPGAGPSDSTANNPGETSGPAAAAKYRPAARPAGRSDPSYNKPTASSDARRKSITKEYAKNLSDGEQAEGYFIPAGSPDSHHAPSKPTTSPSAPAS